MTKLGIVTQSLVPLRAEASSKSELVSQLLLGEVYKVLEEVPDWYRVENQSDNYKGWINSTQFSSLDCNEIPQVILSNFPFTILHLGEAENTIYAFPGSRLYRSENDNYSLNSQTIHLDLSQIKPVKELTHFAKQFLNSPYLWGGKSFSGIDCSGFTQIIYSCVGIQLPRDAFQQAELGESIDFITAVKPGDLAYFANAEGKITHVGMILEGQKIIHAAGKVRIDELDSYGIFNKELGKHTHHLKLIKRLSS